MDRPVGCGTGAEAPEADASGGAGAGQECPQGAAASTGGGPAGRPEGAASAAPPGRTAEGGGAEAAGVAGRSSLPPQGGRTLSARELAERMYESRKTGPRYITIRFDPCNLESKYSESEIRKMIASGEVIEYTTPWREKILS